MIYKGLVSYDLFQSILIKNDLKTFQKWTLVSTSELVMRGVPSQYEKVGSQWFS